MLNSTAKKWLAKHALLLVTHLDSHRRSALELQLEGYSFCSTDRTVPTEFSK